MNIDPDMEVGRANWLRLVQALGSFFGPGLLVFIDTDSWMLGLATALGQLYILMVVQIYTEED